MEEIIRPSENILTPPSVKTTFKTKVIFKDRTHKLYFSVVAPSIEGTVKCVQFLLAENKSVTINFAEVIEMETEAIRQTVIV